MQATDKTGTELGDNASAQVPPPPPGSPPPPPEPPSDGRIEDAVTQQDSGISGSQVNSQNQNGLLAGGQGLDATQGGYIDHPHPLSSQAQAYYDNSGPWHSYNTTGSEQQGLEGAYYEGCFTIDQAATPAPPAKRQRLGRSPGLALVRDCYCSSFFPSVVQVYTLMHRDPDF